MADIINSRELEFEPGSIEARSFNLLHTHGGGGLCGACLLAWLARVAGAPGHGAGSAAILEEARHLVYGQGGVVLSTCFDALAYRGHTARRRRFEELERLLEASRLLCDLPVPPGTVLNWGLRVGSGRRQRRGWVRYVRLGRRQLLRGRVPCRQQAWARDSHPFRR